MNKGQPREQRQVIERAVEAGITYFDTAPNYGDGLSETNLGRAIRELGVRDRVMIGTKVGLLEADMVEPERAVRRIFEASLERLRVERVDLLFLHSQVRLTPDERSISLAGAHVAARLFDQIKMDGRRRSQRIYRARRRGRGQESGSRRTLRYAAGLLQRRQPERWLRGAERRTAGL